MPRSVPLVALEHVGLRLLTSTAWFVLIVSPVYLCVYLAASLLFPALVGEESAARWLVGPILAHGAGHLARISKSSYRSYNEFALLPFIARALVNDIFLHLFHALLTWWVLAPRSREVDAAMTGVALALSGGLYSLGWSLSRKDRLILHRVHVSRVMRLKQVFQDKHFWIRVGLLSLVSFATARGTNEWVLVPLAIWCWEVSGAISKCVDEEVRFTDLAQEDMLLLLQSSDPASLYEAFRCLPLRVDLSQSEGVGDSTILTRGLTVGNTTRYEAVKKLNAWWSDRVLLAKHEARVGAGLVDVSAARASLWRTRFEAVAQAVYAGEVVLAGGTFARPKPRMSFFIESLHARAFRLMATVEPKSYSAREATSVLEACIDAMDAFALRLATFVQRRAAEPVDPIDPKTGLSLATGFVVVKAGATSEERRLAQFAAWEAFERSKEANLVSTTRVLRWCLGSLVWDFDPIHEERLRRWGKSAPPKAAGFSWTRRNVVSGLLDAPEELVDACEAAVRWWRSFNLVEYSVTLKASMGQLVQVFQDVDRVLKLEQRPTHELGPTLFCLEKSYRDLCGQSVDAADKKLA